MSSDPRWGDDARDTAWENVQRDRESRERDQDSKDPRDAFMSHVGLPRGPDRETVRNRGREYSLRGSETRTLATVGAFRVVPTGQLRDHNNTAAHDRSADIRHLREQGLIETVRVPGHRGSVAVLTKQDRDLLERHRHTHSERSQAGLYDSCCRHTLPRSTHGSKVLFAPNLPARCRHGPSKSCAGTSRNVGVNRRVK